MKGYNVAKKSISAQLNEVAKLPKKEQVAALQAFDSPALRIVLNHAVNPNIKFALPEGKTPFTPSTLEPTPTAFLGELRRLYLFVEGGHPTLKNLRREQLWVEFMQYIDPEDAELMDLVKDKKLPEGLTAKTVLTAFPNLY